MTPTFKRNIVNHEDLQNHLTKLKSQFDNSLFHEFIDTRVKNFFLSHGSFFEDPSFQASFPGPYHKLTFSEIYLFDPILEKLMVDIVKGRINSSLKLTQVPINIASANDLIFQGETKSYFVYQINSMYRLSQVGKELHNCLGSQHSLGEGKKYYVLKNKETQNSEIAIYIEDDFIVEVRKNHDLLPDPHQWQEIKLFFKDCTKGKLKSSSKIFTFNLFFISLVYLFSALAAPLSTVFLSVSYALLILSISFSLFYCATANIHSATLHGIFKKLKVQRLFYETNS